MEKDINDVTDSNNTASEGNAQGRDLDDYNDVLTVKELCSLLGICRGTAYKYMRSGTIPYKRLGSKIFISKKAVVEALL